MSLVVDEFPSYCVIAVKYCNQPGALTGRCGCFAVSKIGSLLV